MSRYAILGASIFALAAGTVSADHNWIHTQQREQAHQMYLTPREHQALHQGYNAGYGSGYYQPNYGATLGGYGGSNYWTGAGTQVRSYSPAPGCNRGNYYGGGFGW